MSYQAVQWALNAHHTGPLAPETRLVLVVMAERADQKGRNVYLSAGTIAASLGTTERSVRRNLRVLRDLDLILCGNPEVIPDSYRHDRRPVVYNLAMTARRGDSNVTPLRGPERASRPDSNVTPFTAYGVTAVSARGDSSVRHGVTAVSPKPLIDPPINHLWLSNTNTSSKWSERFDGFASIVRDALKASRNGLVFSLREQAAS